MKLDFRHKEALAWAIQAELYRRHPEIHPHSFWRILAAGGGGYYCSASKALGFTIGFDEDSGASVGLSLQDTPLYSPDVPMEDMYELSSVREAVKLFESMHGLPSPKETPVTTETSIAFRLIAAVLTNNINAYQWTTAVPPDFIGYSQHGGGDTNDQTSGVISPDDSSGSIWEAWRHFRPNGLEHLTYIDSIWKVATLRPIDEVGIKEFRSTDLDRGSFFYEQWRIIEDTRQASWKKISSKPLFNVKGSIWVAPNIGKAYNGSEVINLLQVFNDCNRDIQRTCLEVFNWNKQ
tara:strand:- start:238 stop:1113 length:876 start_codon:yes stop_codon:yes gene_type:complete